MNRGKVTYVQRTIDHLCDSVVHKRCGTCNFFICSIYSKEHEDSQKANNTHAPKKACTERTGKGQGQNASPYLSFAPLLGLSCVPLETQFFVSLLLVMSNTRLVVLQLLLLMHVHTCRLHFNDLNRG